MGIARTLLSALWESECFIVDTGKPCGVDSHQD
jgi:hypothetical protein